MTANITPSGKFAFYSHEGIQVIETGGLLPEYFSTYCSKVYYILGNALYESCEPYHKSVKIANVNGKIDYLSGSNIHYKKAKEEDFIWVDNCMIYPPKHAKIIDWNFYDDERYEVVVTYLLGKDIYHQMVTLVDTRMIKMKKPAKIVEGEYPENTSYATCAPNSVNNDCITFADMSEYRKTTLNSEHLYSNRRVIIGRMLNHSSKIKMYKNHTTMEFDNDEIWAFSYGMIYANDHYIRLADYPDFRLEAI
jgi:hypothetical protein